MSHDAEARSRADQEATDWLIRLAEAETVEVFDAFEAWATASTLNAQAWAEVGRISHMIQAAAPAPATRAPRRRIWDGRGAGQGRRMPRRRLVAGLVASAGALLAVVSTPEAILRVRSDYVTVAEELKTVRLPDGGTMTLAPRSAATVDYDDGERRVRLLRGDAYFEVARNPDRPFRVLSALAETTVLGTGFEVRTMRDAALVGVRHGRVRVQPKSGHGAVLTAGQGVRLNEVGRGIAFETHPDNIAAWTRKQLIVEARPAAEVVDALRPWYGGVILAQGERLKTSEITGVYDLSDPVGALIALSRANNASVVRISPWLIVISFD